MDRDQRLNRGWADLSGVVYGVHVRGGLPEAFRPYLQPTGGRFEPAEALALSYRLLEEMPEVEEIWASEGKGPGGTARFALFRQPDGFGLTVSSDGRGVFRCTPSEVRIEWAAQGAGAPHYFFSYALPLWLEARGVPVLHGSAVSLGGRAIAFVGPSGVGKSVLCAELLRLGFGYLADDGLALRRGRGGEWRCSSGPPLLRLWPSGLERRLEIAADDLPKVHEALEKRQVLLAGEGEGSGPVDGLPLAAVYVLRRRPAPGGSVRTTAGGPRDALVRLLEHGVAAAPAAALGLARQRLELLADVVEKVPVRRLSFPSGSDSAPRIRQAILRDLEDMS
ncbi:MAG TPA: hypothetical protein VMR44_06975 [Thermoanaerobaculia bacterium]|nr:hypothetical protein [Thermoanaerobaculia bacterium]